MDTTTRTLAQALKRQIACNRTILAEHTGSRTEAAKLAQAIEGDRRTLTTMTLLATSARRFTESA